MIYELPRNESVQSKLPTFPTQAQFDRFLSLIKQGLTSRGYVISEVYPGPFGTIMVDADRDPTAEWVDFTLPNSTPKEDADTTKINRALALITKLDAGTNPTAAEVRESLAFLLRAELEDRGINVP